VQAREGLNIASRFRCGTGSNPNGWIPSTESSATGREEVVAPLSHDLPATRPNYMTRIFATRGRTAYQSREAITRGWPATASSCGKCCCAIATPVNMPRILRSVASEQENERLGTEQEQGKTSQDCGAEAEAQKSADVSRREASQCRVLQAKAESDAMQYTLR